MSDKPFAIGINKAPEDPEEKKAWVEQMKRIQISMWVDGKNCCAECGHVYSSVDDFIRCNPRHGGFDKQKNIIFVDESCWIDYARKTEQGKCLP